MTKREQMLQDLNAELEKVRRNGTVNPQFSYFQRLTVIAHHDDDFLEVLHRRVQLEGGFKS